MLSFTIPPLWGSSEIKYKNISIIYSYSEESNRTHLFTNRLKRNIEMNLSALRTSLQNQINQIIANTEGELSANDIGQLIARETQHAINRLALLEDLPFGEVDGLDRNKLADYQHLYRQMLDHLLIKNNDAFAVVTILEELRIIQVKDKITLEACMSDLARRCDSVYKSGWTIMKEACGYGDRKWADRWSEVYVGKTDHVEDRTMDAPTPAQA